MIEISAECDRYMHMSFACMAVYAKPFYVYEISARNIKLVKHICMS